MCFTRSTTQQQRAAHLTEVVEVVFVSNPFVRRVGFVDAVGLIVDVTNVWTLAIIERTLKQLQQKHTQQHLQTRQRRCINSPSSIYIFRLKFTVNVFV